MPEFLADPSVLTKEKLKSELIANNVSLPGGEQRKDVYVQLYLQHLTARNPPAAAQPDFSSDEEREHTPLAARNRGAAAGRVSTAASLPRHAPGPCPRSPGSPAASGPLSRPNEAGVRRRGASTSSRVGPGMAPASPDLRRGPARSCPAGTVPVAWGRGAGARCQAPAPGGEPGPAASLMGSCRLRFQVASRVCASRWRRPRSGWGGRQRDHV